VDVALRLDVQGLQARRQVRSRANARVDERGVVGLDVPGAPSHRSNIPSHRITPPKSRPLPCTSGLKLVSQFQAKRRRTQKSRDMTDDI
jgi:hypothetical protein